MKIVLPTDCGNSPRIALVGELVTNWAQNQVDEVRDWLAPDLEWSIVGEDVVHNESTVDRVFPAQTLPGQTLAALEVTTIITHGRLASCDGFLETDSGRTAFSHVFRFASPAKTAKIREARTYLVAAR